MSSQHAQKQRWWIHVLSHSFFRLQQDFIWQFTCLSPLPDQVKVKLQVYKTGNVESELPEMLSYNGRKKHLCLKLHYL